MCKVGQGSTDSKLMDTLKNLIEGKKVYEGHTNNEDTGIDHHIGHQRHHLC